MDTIFAQCPILVRFRRLHLAGKIGSHWGDVGQRFSEKASLTFLIVAGRRIGRSGDDGTSVSVVATVDASALATTCNAGAG